MSTKAQHAARYRHLTKLLQQLRTEAGLSQREVGERLKRPQSWVYKCESGIRRVDLPEFLDWAEACDADPIAAVARFQKLRRG